MGSNTCYPHSNSLVSKQDTDTDLTNKKLFWSLDGLKQVLSFSEMCGSRQA